MMTIFRQLALLTALVGLSVFAFAKPPDCTDPSAWPAGMAFTQLKNAGVLDNDQLDFDKTVVKRLASERISEDLFRQVHLVRFIKKSGQEILTVTVNEVSSEECSMSDVDVYLVSKRLGNDSAAAHISE